MNAAIIENPPKQSLDEYLDNMSLEAKARTAIHTRECEVTTYPLTSERLTHRNQMNILGTVRTANASQRPTPHLAEIQRASTVENPASRHLMTERKIPMIKPVKQLLKPRQLNFLSLPNSNSRSTIRIDDNKSRESSIEKSMTMRSGQPW